MWFSGCVMRDQNVGFGVIPKADSKLQPKPIDECNDSSALSQMVRAIALKESLSKYQFLNSGQACRIPIVVLDALSTTNQSSGQP